MLNRALKNKVILSALGGLLGSSLWAQAKGTMSDPDTLLGPVAAARGGAMVASEAYHDSLLMNPASSAFQTQYVATGLYSGAGDMLSASIVDTKSGPIGGGAFYVRRNLKTAGGKNPLLGSNSSTEERAGISVMGKINNQIGLGLTGKWAYRRSFDIRLENGKAWNLDAGFRYAIAPTVVVGVLGQNLMGDDQGLYLKTFRFGLEWQVEAGLLISGQVNKIVRPESSNGMTLPKSDDLINYGLGVEYLVAEAIKLRGGYAAKPTWDQNLLSLGLGYDAKSFQLDYAFEAGLKNAKAKVHRVALSAFF